MISQIEFQFKKFYGWYFYPKRQHGSVKQLILNLDQFILTQREREFKFLLEKYVIKK